MLPRRLLELPRQKGCSGGRPPRLPIDDRVERYHERYLRRWGNARRSTTRNSPHITLEQQQIGALTTAEVRRVESEHMVHWGRAASVRAPSWIVCALPLVQCPRRSKVTSSGGMVSFPARTWGLKLLRYCATLPPSTDSASAPLSAD